MKNWSKKTMAWLLMLTPMAVFAREATVTSPDGKLQVTINDNGGRATYAVTLDGQPMLLPSALGFKADFGDFTQGLKITNTKAGQIDRCYEMRQVKQSHIHYEATLLTVDFENTQQQRMSVEFSVSNNDLGFRYLIPRQKDDNPKSAVILEESTAFCLPQGTTTFLTPQSGEMVGWERTKPSYEEDYHADAPMTERSQFGKGYTFPCLFKIGDGANGTKKTNNGWVLISETGVSSAYCGSRLSDYSLTSHPSPLTSSGFYQIAYPMPGENNGNGTSSPGISLPGQTPWRTVTVGNSLKPIVETTVAYDLVEPLYEPSIDYQSGRYTWSWLIWQDNSINYDDQVQFIDLASAMGFELCLVDNWWDQNIGRDRMAELSRYAQSKGVSLMLWYNSNGYENNAPQTPRDCMSNSIARDREMAWLRSIGVKGIKVDFFGGDKQETMRLYEDILFDANRYGLQCIFHGCTLPRGWERMYPNYVASEAVLASENVFFSEGHARTQAFELCMHPFCRNATGTMDWGGIIMNKNISKDNKSRHRRYTTDIFEMASGITNQTAIQCVAMQPNNLGELPQFELDWLRAMPTTWDETCFIDGYPGRYVVLARRHGDDWYVVGLNAQQEPLKLTLTLPIFPAKTQLKYYVDDPKTGQPVLTTLKTDKRQQLRVEMQPNGGLILQQ
ncbi:MAG: glycoside hydrolase family 97 catalytic domain-containing protein [Prevotella sp.]|nr:glycoside hydrolase family 97 catalytic domain-containing protein [Prevotella sp.]